MGSLAAFAHPPHLPAPMFAAPLVSLVLLGIAPPHGDGEPAVVLLQDDFERAEKDDAEEQVGGGWGTNSKSRAKGHKQVDLEDGALHVT